MRALPIALRPRPARSLQRSSATLVTAAVLAMACCWVASPSRASAQPEVEAIDPLSVPDPRLDPALVRVPVDSAAYRAAAARYRATEAALRDAVLRRETAETEIVALVEAEQRLDEQLVLTDRRRTKADIELALAEERLEQLAIGSYVRGGVGGADDLGLDTDAELDRHRQRVLVRSAFRLQLADQAYFAESSSRLSAAVTELQNELAEVRRRLADAEQRRTIAAGDQERLTAQALREIGEVADARLTSQVLGTEMRLVVLDAYVKAERAMSDLSPACGVSWPMLAGIGRTESRHGTYGGSEVNADGSLTKPIIGIALDGSNNTAVIRDTDGGRYDGDAAFDRAVGPMQFIPSTWARWGRDGTGNGEADPQNMYDSALAAAAYLCASGPGLDQEPGARRALLSYNRSTAYVNLVLERAEGYASLRLLG